jgi:hypothetical protein
LTGGVPGRIVYERQQEGPMGARKLRAATIAAFALFALATPATAANWLELNFGLFGPRYDGHLPACDDGWALGRISGRFAEKEGRFWVSDLAIVGFDQIREIALRPWGHNFIPRRYCTARARLSNGVETTVNYSIAEDLGMIGMTWGVDWCVVGYDRNLAFAPRCKMARP